jgi:3-carboxy-cis,cis-muconate cycloisomerase
MLERIFAPASIDSLFSDAAMIAAMARFETALARAQASVGLVPPSAAETIARVCHEMGDPAATDGNPDSVAGGRFDAARLYGAARASGSLAAPFLRALGEQVAAHDPQAQRYLNLGATDEDLLDSSLAMQCKEAGRRMLDAIERTGAALAGLAQEHRQTLMVGRALLQPVASVTFGWKAAQWLDPLSRCRRHLRATLLDAAVLQLGGPAGNRSSVGGDPEQSAQVAQRVADALGLLLPAAGWSASRDRFARLGCELAIVCGQVGKIGQDIALMMQVEVGELEEAPPPGRATGASFMTVPAGALLMREASLRAPGLAGALLNALPVEHEQGLAGWQSTWWTLRGLFGATASALLAAEELLTGLQVKADAMQANLARNNALIYSESVVQALTPRLGAPAARTLVIELCRAAIDRDLTLRQILGRDTRISALMNLGELERLFDPAAQFRASDPLIDQMLANWRASR